MPSEEVWCCRSDVVQNGFVQRSLADFGSVPDDQLPTRPGLGRNLEAPEQTSSHRYTLVRNSGEPDLILESEVTLAIIRRHFVAFVPPAGSYGLS